MNQRIRELAEQAGFHGPSMNPVFGTTSETALQNFAELILAECTETVREVLRENENTLDYTTASLLQSRMKTNLGVTQWTI
jgi:hypothetical protein